MENDLDFDAHLPHDEDAWTGQEPPFLPGEEMDGEDAEYHHHYVPRW